MDSGNRLFRWARLAQMAGLAACLAFVSSPVSFGRQAQKALTNAEVLSMLAQGKQEQAILDTLRKNPSTFDVSKPARAAFDKKCAALKHPGVSTGVWAAEIKDIWDTMMNVVICQETNGRGGEGACDLIPQSSPKKTLAPTPAPSKKQGKNKYDAITLERGVTSDKGFANWANSGQAPRDGSASGPKIPPVQSNPKRDAAGAMDVAMKAEIKQKLETQIAALRKNTKVLHTAVIRPAPGTPREIQALRRQKLFVDTLRMQGAGTLWDLAPASLYNVQQKGTQIAVDWGVDHYSWNWLGMFNVDDEYNAGYSLQVYVSGQIGVDPWTGQPTTTH